MRAVGQSDVGREREINEDRVLAAPEAGLVMLADGMGGHAGGEVASSLAVAAIGGCLREQFHRNGAGPPQADVSQALIRAFALANEQILARVALNPDLKGMGTTVVLAIAQEAEVHLAHVGDSRAYMFRRGALVQLTEDHSMTAQMVRAGEISESQARTHRLRNYLTRSLGHPSPEPEIQKIAWGHGDCLLLCSDGLTTMVEDRKIAKILGRYSGDLAACCEELIDAANSKGGKDNISVVVACPD